MSSFRPSTTYARAALLGYVVLLFALTLGPLPAMRQVYSVVPIADKLVHAGLFAGLASLLYWNLGSIGRARRLFWSVALSAAVAGLIEILQGPLPYRSAEWLDFFAGGAGAAAAVLVMAVAFGERSRTEPPAGSTTRPPAG
jgi:VanZ family protein